MPSDEAIVRRYFREVVDGRRSEALSELFAPDCRIVRADRGSAIEGIAALERFVRMSVRAVPEIRTTFRQVVADGAGSVAVAVEHEVRFGPLVATPLGLCLARGRRVSWSAMAFFRIEEGRIVEERVVRDEIGILAQLGMLKRPMPARLGVLLGPLLRITRRKATIS